MSKQRLTAQQRSLRRARTKQWRQAQKKQNTIRTVGLLFLGAFIETLLNNKED